MISSQWWDIKLLYVHSLFHGNQVPLQYYAITSLYNECGADHFVVRVSSSIIANETSFYFMKYHWIRPKMSASIHSTCQTEFTLFKIHLFTTTQNFNSDSAVGRYEKQTVSRESIFISFNLKTLIHQPNKEIKKLKSLWTDACFRLKEIKMWLLRKKNNIFFNMQTSVIHHYRHIFNKEWFLFPYVSNNRIWRKKAITFTNAGRSFSHIRTWLRLKYLQ